MSKAHRSKKNNDIVVQKSVVSTIIPLLIIFGFIVLTGIFIINIMSNSNEYGSKNDPWAAAYEKAESSVVGIVFNDITTSVDEYKSLEAACNDYIKQNKSPDTNVNVNTVISEKTYVDGSANALIGDNKSKSDMVETGPLYFQDMVLLRYINDAGQLKIVTAISNNNSVQTLKQSELADYISKIKSSETQESPTNDKAIPESTYISSIEDTVLKMVEANTNADKNEAEKLAINYFTEEGKNSVFSSKSLMKIDKDSKVSIVFTIACKSNTNITSKDRIYMQFEVDNGATKTTVNMILKLNDNNRIFDIDII